MHTFYPLLHSFNSKTAACLGMQTSSIISKIELHRAVFARHFNRHLRGIGMFEHIGQTFLNDTEKLKADCRRQLWQFRTDLNVKRLSLLDISDQMSHGFL